MFDWTHFRSTVYLRVPLAVAYAAWSTARGLERWFPATATIRDAAGKARRHLDLARGGDLYRFTWFGGHVGGGKILAARHPTTVRFTFGDPVVVTARLQAVRGGTRVTVVQEGIPDSARHRVHTHLKCRLSWCFYLNNLKAVLEHGVDLRDRDPSHLKSHLESGIVSY